MGTGGDRSRHQARLRQAAGGSMFTIHLPRIVKAPREAASLSTMMSPPIIWQKRLLIARPRPVPRGNGKRRLARLKWRSGTLRLAAHRVPQVNSQVRPLKVFGRGLPIHARRMFSACCLSIYSDGSYAPEGCCQIRSRNRSSQIAVTAARSVVATLAVEP
jgi:hypothetical protein